MDKLPQPDPNAVMKVTRWVLMAFFAYVLFHAVFGKNPSPTSTDTAASSTASSTGQPAATDVVRAQDCEKKHFPIFSVALLPQLVPVARYSDVTKGTGQAALCGQHAEVRYEYRDGSKILGHGTKNVAIGDGQLVRGAETGMMGMKPGGERKIIVPFALAYKHDKDVDFILEPASKQMTATVRLEKLSSTYPQSPMPLRVAATSVGGGSPAECGDRVTVNISFWKPDGTNIFSTEDHPVAFTLGKAEVPYGIEQALLNAREHSELAVIIPPAFAKPLQGNADSKTILPALPENEVVIANIELLHVGEAPVKQTFSPAGDKEAPTAKKDTKDTKDDKNNPEPTDKQ